LKVIAVPSDDPARAADVLKEGRLLARIRHPNVITVYGAQEYRGSVGIWMELVRGRTLSELVRQDGRLGPEEAIVIGESVLRALAAVHAAGLVHRDVKAQNVMRESGGRIVLMDFGAGWERGELGHKREVSPEGTPLYMAPELLAGQLPSATSDLYSVGVLLFFLVTGTHPVDGRTVTEIALAHGLGRRRLLTDLRPDLPESFIRVVERALSPTPDRRYPSAGAMAQELADAWREPAGHSDQPKVGAQEPAASSAEQGGVRLETLPVARGRATLAVWAGSAAAATAAIWVLGALTSAAYDLTLGRSGKFATESPLDWWVWGFRSLVAPTFWILATVVVVRLSHFVLRTLARAARVRRIGERVAAVGRSTAVRLGLDNAIAAGQILVVLQAVTVAWVFWHFFDLIAAFTSVISYADASTLSPLAPDNSPHQEDYRTVLPVLIFAMTAAWVRVLRWRRRSGLQGDRLTLVAGAALAIALVFLAQVPYRLLNFNVFQRVMLAEERCYAIGEGGNELLLYCPDAAVPRNKVVPAGHARLERTAIMESIFTRPGASRAPETNGAGRPSARERGGK
jgi:hypothetical protein